MCSCISPRLTAVHDCEPGHYSPAHVSSVQHHLNVMVSENPFLIPVVKSHSAGSPVLMRRKENFPSARSNQTTSSQPRGGNTTSSCKGLYADKLCPV